MFSNEPDQRLIQNAGRTPLPVFALIASNILPEVGFTTKHTLLSVPPVRSHHQQLQILSEALGRLVSTSSFDNRNTLPAFESTIETSLSLHWEMKPSDPVLLNH